MRRLLGVFGCRLEIAAQRQVTVKQPMQLRGILRRTSLTIGDPVHFGSVDEYHLTAPILPSERPGDPADPDIGRSARLDMYSALRLVLEKAEQHD